MELIVIAYPWALPSLDVISVFKMVSCLVMQFDNESSADLHLHVVSLGSGLCHKQWVAFGNWPGELMESKPCDSSKFKTTILQKINLVFWYDKNESCLSMQYFAYKMGQSIPFQFWYQPLFVGRRVVMFA